MATGHPFADLLGDSLVRTTPTLELPLYWNLLTDLDRATYLSIRQAFSSSSCKHRRHHATDVNREILASLRAFVVRGDPDDWKRALVCGICWLADFIAINTRQLRLLIGKCKSSINSMLQNIGYVTIPTARDRAVALVDFFPILKDNFPELRKWTMRAKLRDQEPLANGNAFVLIGAESQTQGQTTESMLDVTQEMTQ
jgi:hypothetical protein